MNKLIYTFRTFPWLSEIENFQPFVLDKLKNDILQLQLKLLKEQPEYLIGLAISSSTRFEPTAYNKFNHGKVNKQGKEQYGLFVPNIAGTRTATAGTNSFCNWTMYRLAEFIVQEKLPIKLAFLHMDRRDKQLMLEILPKIN
jgi:hypothetical protein